MENDCLRRPYFDLGKENWLKETGSGDRDEDYEDVEREEKH